MRILHLFLLLAFVPSAGFCLDLKHYDADVAALLKEYQRQGSSLEQDELGDDPALMSVEYDNGSHTVVDFRRGAISVSAAGLGELKWTVKQLLLTQFDPSDLYVNLVEEFGLVKQDKAKPFFYGQIVDADGQPIAYEWRANRYADHVLAQASSTDDGRYQVTIPLVNNHSEIAGGRYAQWVRAAGARHRVKFDLMMAIMETESAFNPKARSRSNALGLMQIKANTAGRDYFAIHKGYKHTPSSAYLYDPKNNIEVAAGYIQILQSRYLKGINHPTKLEYATIASYNGGSGNLWKSLDSRGNQRRAIERINRMSVKDLYWFITNRHIRQETRNYLKKVASKQPKYR